MMYSYVVRSTWNAPWRISHCACLRCVGEPLYEIMRTDGAHFSNSMIQLGIVERGTMTRNGPFCFLDSMRNVMRAIVWIVLPSPCSRVSSTQLVW